MTIGPFHQLLLDSGILHICQPSIQLVSCTSILCYLLCVSVAFVVVFMSLCKVIVSLCDFQFFLLFFG